MKRYLLLIFAAVFYFIVIMTIGTERETLALGVVIFLPFLLNIFISKINNVLIISGALSFIIFIIMARAQDPYSGMGAGLALLPMILLAFIYLISGFVDKLGFLLNKPKK